MKRFVNYRKRSIELPKGCKDLFDLLKPQKQSQQVGEGSLETIRESKCEYCGAPAVTGWGSGVWGADGTKNEENHFWCEPCDEDLTEFRSKPENQLPRLAQDFDFNDPKATEPLERLMQEIQKREAAFMRQKLAERKGPEHTAQPFTAAYAPISFWFQPRANCRASLSVFVGWRAGPGRLVRGLEIAAGSDRIPA